MSLPSTRGPLAEALEAALRPLDAHTAATDARYILKRRAGLDWSVLITEPGAQIAPEILSLIEADLARALTGEPLSRIYGEREFYGLTFKLSPDTLDPRPDTEVLVGLALERLKGVTNPRILDLGTGSGCILLSILHESPAASGVGIDLAPGAVQTAKENAEALGLAQRANFLCGNWAEGLEEQFDLLVSNPPYITNPALESLSSTVLNHDPILALKGGEDGMQAYREIFLQLPHCLKPGGLALFEIGFDQGEIITRLSEESRFSDIAIHPDSAGLARVAEVHLD